MSVVLDNMHFTRYKHFDLWLKDRRREKLTPNLDLAEPLAGYGHRQSLTSRAGPVFGGAWVPFGLRPGEPFGLRPGCEQERSLEDIILDDTPKLVREWVLKCRRANPDVKRGDPVAERLELPVPPPDQVEKYGLYEINPPYMRCSIEVPFEEQTLFERPRPLRIADPYFLGELEPYWEVKHWTDRMESTLGPLSSKLRRDAVFLANERFRGVAPSDAQISARFMGFVAHAGRYGLGPEALALACLMEHDAVTFSREIAAVGTGEDLLRIPPLVILSHVLHDLDTFLRRARKEAAAKKKSLVDFHLNVRKLRSAAAWFQKVAGSRYSDAKLSNINPMIQEGILAHCLGAAMPEIVAYEVGEHWYAGGMRVRGTMLPADDNEPAPLPDDFDSWPWKGMPSLHDLDGTPLRTCVLIGAFERPWAKKSDANQRSLHPTFGAVLTHPHNGSVMTATIVGDSTIKSEGVRYSLTMLLRAAGVVPVWMVTLPGAKAADLMQGWSFAPPPERSEPHSLQWE